MIGDYIAAHNPDAALALDTQIDERSKILTDFHAAGRPGRLAGTRELSVHDTRYVIIYRVEGEVIWILRVLHTSRQWHGDI